MVLWGVQRLGGEVWHRVRIMGGFGVVVVVVGGDDALLALALLI